MKKDNKHAPVAKANKGKELKQGLPEKNNMTNTTKNTAATTPGLNQSKVTRDDLFPSDGDNLTI